MTLLYQAVQILYWLVLCIWLGGMVFLAVAAPIIFKVVRRLDVRSGKHTDPNLIDEQTSVVGGEIVGTLLARMGQVEMLCATVMLPLMIAQLFLIDLAGTNFIAAMLRFGLFAVALALLSYEWRLHYPRTWELRRRLLANAGEPDKANPLREAFEREHRRSEQLFLAMICVVVGMVMLSANILPRTTMAVPAAMLTPVTQGPAR